MQRQQTSQRSAGAKAIAIDSRVLLARYRLLQLQLLALLLSAGFALGLHLIFGH